MSSAPISFSVDMKNELFALITQANQVQSKELKTDFQNALQSLAEDVASSKHQVHKLQEKFTVLDRKSRKNNIVIFGLTVEKTQLLENTVLKLNELLDCNLSEADVNNIFFLGNSTNPPILLELISYLKKASLFKKANKLKGTGISISNDLSPDDRQDRKVLLKHLKSARTQNHTAKIQGQKLIVENTTYTIEELKKLEQNTEEITDSEESEADSVSAGVSGTSEKNKNNQQDTKGKRKRRKIQYSPIKPSADTEENNTRRTRANSKP